MEQVEIFPSFWFLLVALLVMSWVKLVISFEMDKVNDKLDTLIKIEQTSLMYKQ
jgi:hypothetical protein